MSTATTHIKTDKQLVPELRFKGFDGEWERNYVNDLASKLKVGFVGTCEPYYTTSEEGILLVRTGNLKGVHIELDEEKYVTREFHDKNKKSQIYPGDLLLARHGGNGEICRVPEDFPTANCLNIVILRTNSELQSEYFQLVYSSFAVQKQISAVTAGSTQGVINTKEIGKLKIVHPTLPEQQKIASFLTAVDDKVQQLTKKKELLAQYKKGVMQRLFSGQLRFKNEHGVEYPDWEEKKLGDVGKVKMCKRIFSYQTTEDGEIPFYKIGTFGKNPDAYIPMELFLEFKEKYSYPKVGEILMSASGTLGRTVVYDGSEAYYQDSNIVWIENNEELITNEFLFYVYQTVRYQSEGGTIQRLYNSIISSAKFLRPSLVEQSKVTKLLSSIDTKIETVNNQITQTQTFKKGLLQQMFV